MAKFEFDFEGLDKQLTKLDNFSEVATEILEQCGPILVANVKSECAKHVVTHSMVDSIKQTKVIKRKDGYGIVARPTGIDENGVRNMEKIVYAEYGTSKQYPTPILSVAIDKSKKEIETVMQQIYDREVAK
jgi:HK97 gp10 family phage protein